MNHWENITRGENRSFASSLISLLPYMKHVDVWSFLLKQTAYQEQETMYSSIWYVHPCQIWNPRPGKWVANLMVLLIPLQITFPYLPCMEHQL